MIARPDYQLCRNAFGRLEFSASDGETHDGVVPVRSFPINAPDQGIALVDPYGHELAWIDRLADLPATWGSSPLNWVWSTIHSLKLSTVTSSGSSLAAAGGTMRSTAESTKPTQLSRVA